MKKKYYYLLVIILMTSLVVGTKGFNMFGSYTDWYNQHAIFLQILKRVFLSSNNYLVPYIGGITNIFSLSYYGLFNPLYIPYFFIDINPYLYMSYLYMFMYFVIGISTFSYLSTKYDNKKSLLGTVIVITASPILFHLHRQVMFVNYLPFLLLGLYSIDKNKKGLLSLSVLLISITSFFYIIPSVVVLLIYYLYRNNSKKLVKDLGIPIIQGILGSMFLLLPTFINLISNRLSSSSLNMLILVPNITFNSILYDEYSLGNTLITLFIIYLSLFNKNKRIRNLGIVLSIIFLFGLFSFLMNGMLYARSKVLIPFIYLVVILVLDSIDSIKEIKYRYILLFFIMLVVSFVLVYMNTKYIYLFILETIIILMYVILKNKKILTYSLVLTSLVSCFIVNYKSDYPDYINHFDKDINNLLNNVSKDRVSVLVDEGNNYNNKYDVYSTSIYSSSINKYYYRFVRDYLDLDSYGENYLMINPSSNIIYNTYMSNKYIIDYKDKNYLGYEEVSSSGLLSLYKNNNVLPVIYSSNNKNILLDLNNLEEYHISSLEDNYELSLDDSTSYNNKLDEELTNKVLVIKFNINSNKEERLISINDVTNKISSSSWIYYNHNEEFTYYISERSLKELNIFLTKGNYKLSNIESYIIDYDNFINSINTYDKVENLVIENDSIKGNILVKEDGYLLTNIPYDKDYKIYIDDKLVDTELVNNYFVGTHITEGNHSIRIEYQNNYFYIGLVISIISLLSIIIKKKEK